MGTRSRWRIQEDRQTSRKGNKDNKFPPVKWFSWKTGVWNEYAKTKGLHHASKYLIENTARNAPGSFKDKFHPSKLPLNHTTRSSSTYQLKVNNFKTERYGRKSIVNKCTLDWNNLQKIFKQNFQMMKRSDVQTNIKNYFSKQYNDQKD